jgi:hypothetical protein
MCVYFNAYFSLAEQAMEHPASASGGRAGKVVQGRPVEDLLNMSKPCRNFERPL